jgi:hypothetical protein
LIAVPILYYSVFREKEEGEISRRKKLSNRIKQKATQIRELISNKRGA